MSAYTLTLAALRRAITALQGELTEAERREQLRQLDEAAKLLEQSGRQRLPSMAMAQRIAEIESTLSDRSPAERRGIVQQRLGISRASYFRLRRQSHSDETLV